MRAALAVGVMQQHVRAVDALSSVLRAVGLSIGLVQRYQLVPDTSWVNACIDSAIRLTESSVKHMACSTTAQHVTMDSGADKACGMQTRTSCTMSVLSLPCLK